MKWLALCAIGLEKPLKDEIKALGYPIDSAAPGKVLFDGPWEAVYHANLKLRTAERVLLVMGDFVVQDFDRLFEEVRSLPWEDFLRLPIQISVDKARSRASRLSAVTAIQSVTQKAVFERLCAAWGVRELPQSGPEAFIRVYLDKDRALVVLDTSGEGLHRRGYRKMTSDAPLKETIAASLLLFSGWRRKNPLYDPFCGSGTILIEALLYAFNIPPGLHRRFCFEHLRGFSELDWSLIKEEARAGIRMDYPTRIAGSDKDSNVLFAARANLQVWGLENIPRLTQLSMEEARAEAEGGFLITNPPYGERLETKPQAENLSRQMRHFAASFPGWKIGVITSLANFPELFGRTPYVVRDIHNGASEVRYFQFG